VIPHTKIKLNFNLMHRLLKGTVFLNNSLMRGTILFFSFSGGREGQRVGRVRGSKKMSHDLPDEVAGACGQSNIVEKFCEVYEELTTQLGLQKFSTV
jgi:hypothetical protein